jgi:Poly (ADP-ribose) glycohydrolase (PARG), Macro domain fold
VLVVSVCISRGFIVHLEADSAGKMSCDAFSPFVLGTPTSLSSQFPPVIHSANKRVLYDLCTQNEAQGGAENSETSDAPVIKEAEVVVSKRQASKKGDDLNSLSSELSQRNFFAGFGDVSEVSGYNSGDMGQSEGIVGPHLADLFKRTVKAASATVFSYEAGGCGLDYCLPNDPHEENAIDVVGGKGEGDVDDSHTHARVWFVNFADPSLFVAYGSGMFAQDEIQAVEHPLLGSVREALKHYGREVHDRYLPRTVHGGLQAGEPTPMLVENVERRCAVDTTNIYGNRFERASPDTVVAATTVLPKLAATRRYPLTNFVCMAALPPNFGRYTLEQIEKLFLTAFLAFEGAAIRTTEMQAKCASPKMESKWECSIHTGNWGCGAFGGNKQLLGAIQVAAAALAGAKLVFHSFDEPSLREFESGMALLAEWASLESNSDSEGKTAGSLLQFLRSKNFQWGKSDGN